jgi:hypothetical protein
MPRTHGLYSWTTLVTSRFPELSRTQAALLALYSFGMVLARTSGLDAIAVQLSVLLGQATNTLRQRLRELYQPAAVKSGRHRTEFDPTRCFAALLRWITSAWAERRLVVALDPTYVGRRFIVLAVSVVYQGCAIPVAWQVLRGNEKGSWNDHWRRLVGRVRDTLGPDWEILALSDRGLESRDLFAALAARDVHPLMRVKAAGTFRPDGWHRSYPMRWFAAAVGRRWHGRGVAYQGDAALPCTLLACWGAGHDEPWLLLTDLGPTCANPAWYAFRAWIEQGFKVLKSGGWHWQRSRVTDPQRAARQWAVLALATLWLVEVGGEAEPLIGPADAKGAAPAETGKGQRAHRLFRLGLAVVLACLLQGGTLPPGSFKPQPWPEIEHDSDALTEEQVQKLNLPL